MKTKAICSFFVLFAIVAGIGATTPAAFAQTEVTIATAEDAMFPDCEPECYTPSTATVDVGGKVIFSNPTGVHTFTAGTVDEDGIHKTGEFDTSYLNAGDSSEWIADVEAGEYPYFCELHIAYMFGLIIVQEAVDEEADAAAQAEADAAAQAEADAAAQAEADAAAQAEADAVAQAEADAVAQAEADAVAQAEADAETMEEDVVLTVTITESAMGDGTHVYLEFSEMQVNYEMIGMQNDEEIFTIPGHAMEMTSDHHIDAVGTPESPLDIKIVSLGIGPSDAEDDWTSATITDGDTLQVVPEFGTIAMMVLAIAIISIVAVTAKSRVVPRF